MAIYVNKDKAKFFLSTPSEDKWFRTINGSIIRNLIELKDYFDEVSDEEFIHHCNRERNDYYNWVKFVFGNERLAESLRKARTGKEAKMYVDRNILMLESNLIRAGELTYSPN